MKESVEAKKAVGTAEESGKSNASFSLRNEFANEIDRWYINGRTNDESFILGSTGDVLQGLGAIESDIYLNGDKINTILETHPEMTIDEIKMIGQIVENPAIVLKSKNIKRKGRPNTRPVMFGNIKAQNGKPVLAVLDLKPVEKNLVINDMQKISSAYTKTNDPIGFVEQSTVVYLDKKRATKVLRAIGFQMPTALADSGFIGSITYSRDNVNISGKDFRNVVDTSTQFSMRVDSEGRELSEAQQEFFKDSKVRDEEGRLLTVYHTTDNDFTVFDREKLGMVTDSNADDVSFAATSHIGFWFNSDNIQKKTAQDKALSGYLKIENPYYVDSIRNLSEQTADIYGENYDDLQERFESRDYKAARELGEGFADWLKQEGYDGVIVNDEEFGGTSYVVLDSNQFKNRTNQTPTENPDIRYSMRGENWKPTLDKVEWRIVNYAIENKTGKELTETTDYFFRKEKGKTVFGIYSTDDSTLLYAVHGEKAASEHDFLTFVLEAANNENINRENARNTGTLLSQIGLQQYRHSGNNGATAKPGRYVGNANVYFGKSRSDASRALQNVLENLFGERQADGSGRSGESGGSRGLTVSDLGKVQYQLRIEDKNRLDILDKQETRLTADLKTLEKAYAEAIRAEYERSIKPSEETSRRAAEINRKAAKRKPTEQKREPPAVVLFYICSVRECS